MKIPVMKPLFFALTAALAVAVIYGYGAANTVHAADDTMPAVGQTAPGFTLPSQDGSQISLDSFKGKWVVLYFYPKDMTQFEAKNAVIVGVSVDTPDSHKQFCTKEGLTFRLLADPEHKVVDQYGSLGHYGEMTIANRNTFLIDPQGKIVKEWTKVSPQGHSAEVLAAIPAS
jgi:peroxiredoxin Q/BCP